MSYLTQLLEPRSLESDTPINNTTLGAILGGYTATTGKSVNVTTAMQLVAVYACIRLISEAVATLPLHLYRRLEQGKERAPEHSLYPVLHDIPNPEMTSVELRETVQAHMLLWGVGYCEVVRNGAGQVKQLWPIIPTRVRPFRNTRNELVYRVTLPDNHFQTLRADRILRMSALLGLSPIGQAREALGLTMAAEEYGARFFANDSRPGGLLEHPGQLSPEASARLRNSWEESQKGLTNAHRIAILEEGLKWVQVGIAPEDAQFLETRKYQLDEIARLYHVPPHMIGDLDRATWANIEHLSIDFVVNTLRPWLVRWEQAIHKTLLVEEERRRYFAEFSVDGLLRGDTATRYQAYATARQNGWLNGNEIREMENLNSVEGLNTYLVNGNMMPVGDAGRVTKPVPAPQGEEEPEEDGDDADAEAEEE